MARHQIDTGKADKTINTNNVWDRIVALETGVAGIPIDVSEQLESHTSQLAQKAAQADLAKTNENHAKYVKSKIINERTQRSNFYLFDSFIRSDSTTSLGNVETDNTGYTLLSNNSLVWGVQSNKAYTVSRSGVGRGVAYRETYESECVLECDMSGVSTGSDGGLAFRITDIDNFWYATVQGTNYSVNLIKYVAGVKTTVFTYWFDKPFTDGKLSVYMKGNKIEVYYDGFLLIKAYDTFNSTSTKHGLYSTGGYPDYRWYNFSVKPLGQIPYYVDEKFENSLTKWYWVVESPNQSYSQTFSSTIKESGSTSLRMELHKDDPLVSSSKRCEIKLAPEKPLEEHWYGVSIYLPNGGDEDFANDVEDEILIQWHAYPDSGESDVNPPLSLITRNGDYVVSQQWDSGRISTTESVQAPSNVNKVNIGSYAGDKGKWVNWVFHVRWGYLDVHEPVCEVFKDGILIYNRKGANTFNDALGTYQKLGIYKWGWKEVNSQSILTKRVVYYDNFLIK
jgi:hypothetical protein